MKDRLIRFMQGRYGNDQFNRFLMFLAMVLLIISIFGLNFFYYVALVIMVYAYYRMFSRQIHKRSSENQKYLQYEWKIKSKFQKKKSEMQQSKTYRIYKCPNCRQKIRVPKGRGRIAITCRKCGHEFIKKS